MTLYIGLMSGTSMDGIDAALVKIPSNNLEYGINANYSDATKDALEKLLFHEETSLASICQLNTLIGRDFAAAANRLLKEAGVLAKDIRAIGSHGQTVIHNIAAPIPYTLQLGCPHTISSLTGITVVADFRTRDVVNGGQGAPFAPLYHQELFLSPQDNIALVNIGGIANITFIGTKTTSGWDVGPGNCLLDAWIRSHQGKAYDKSGAWAATGAVILTLLDELLADPFINKAPPKSVGKEYYSLEWLKSKIKGELPPEDVQATLVVFTARAIANAVLKNPQPVSELYLCGGGVHNVHLFNEIQRLLPEVKVKSCADVGVNPDYLEAMMFAWLASQTMNHMPVNLSAITGSSGLEILGAIYPILKSY
ncbi:MAG: anhydro-N-acetylmuramic acid kinase [Legionella sp.]|nr:MAG: anhydro-N-acetylmuramic acid kinase [Legionella sp.]